jgi:hypothetical protein
VSVADIFLEDISDAEGQGFLMGGPVRVDIGMGPSGILEDYSVDSKVTLTREIVDQIDTESFQRTFAAAGPS